jgi:hypothetical protein
MSSVTKRRCALGLHCAIAQHRVYDHSRDDWIEFQDSDKGMTLQTLLLKDDGAAGETLHLAEDVRMELDYLDALGGRYRCVVMCVLVLNVSHTFLNTCLLFFVRCLRRVPLLRDTYIPYIHVSFFLFVVCGACHSWGTARWWSTGVAAHCFWRG